MLESLQILHLVKHMSYRLIRILYLSAPLASLLGIYSAMMLFSGKANAFHVLLILVPEALLITAFELCIRFHKRKKSWAHTCLATLTVILLLYGLGWLGYYITGMIIGGSVGFRTWMGFALVLMSGAFVALAAFILIKLRKFRQGNFSQKSAAEKTFLYAWGVYFFMVFAPYPSWVWDITVTYRGEGVYQHINYQKTDITGPTPIAHFKLGQITLPVIFPSWYFKSISSEDTLCLDFTNSRRFIAENDIEHIVIDELKLVYDDQAEEVLISNQKEPNWRPSACAKFSNRNQALHVQLRGRVELKNGTEESFSLNKKADYLPPGFSVKKTPLYFGP